MKIPLMVLVFVMICTIILLPPPALANPYQNAGEVTDADTALTITSDKTAESDTSAVTFNGARYTHTLGRVTIEILPQIDGLGDDEKSSWEGNIRRYGTDPIIEYELYRDLIKERITLTSPQTISYAYTLGLSDWTTIEPDESRPVEITDANSTVIVTYPYTNEVTSYAKDSTINIAPDSWGNLIVSVNGADVVVMPKPFAIDAWGKRFELDYNLDPQKNLITITGDLDDAQYPVTIDPTERVTNGGFETGDLSGWNGVGSFGSYSIMSNGAYHGTYFLNVQGENAMYSGLQQTINYNGVNFASCAAAIPGPSCGYDIPVSNLYVSIGNWLINNQGQTVQNWTVRTASPTLSGLSNVSVWTYSSVHGHIDNISVTVLGPPIADLSGTPTSGDAPLTVRFSDSSSNFPTSWSWNFGDGNSTNATLQNPIHTYASSGTYTVELTATNIIGNDTEEKVDYITASPATVCEPTGPYIDFVINYANYGPGCTYGDWEEAACYDNAVIRWALAGESIPFYNILSNWRWKRNNNYPNPGNSFAVEQPYNKDVYIAGIKNTDTGWFHAIDAELLTEEEPENSDWEDWTFFNYDNLDIEKGDYQIPAGTELCRTKVWIRNITSVSGCGYYNGPIEKTFYIDSDLNVLSFQDPDCPEGLMLRQTGKSLISSQDAKKILNMALTSTNQSSRFSISKWQFDPMTNEITFYAYGNIDESVKNSLQGKQINNFTITVILDKEFDTIRADVQKQLIQLRKNPDYMIGAISMVTDPFGDPPGNYAELWVSKSTYENKKMDYSMIQGWTILVYPMST